MEKRGTILKIFVVLIVAFFIYEIAFKDDTNDRMKKLEETQVLEKAKEMEFNAKMEQVKMVYDVPSLLGKNVDEMIKILGKPKDWTEPTNLQMRTGFETWDNTFIFTNLAIMVTYNPKTRQVIDLFIPTSDLSGLTSDYRTLLKKGNLTESNQSYNIKPVKALKDNSKYTGIIVRQ